MTFTQTSPGVFRVRPDAGELAQAQAGQLTQILAAALGSDEPNGKQALELRRAVQLTLRQLTDEAEMLRVAGVYPRWAADSSYRAGEVVRHGVNAVGDAQLYRVLQDHISQADWLPEAAASLYQPIGVGADGVPDWVQPLGTADAYALGDVVRFEGLCYRSVLDGNVWSPVSYPDGWELV